MLGFLKAAGFEPGIVYEPERPTTTPEVEGLEHRIVAEGYQIVFLQKVHGRSVERLTQRLAEHGVATVFGVCDLIAPEMVMRTDATVAVTDFLRNLYPPTLHHKIHVVHDGIENPGVFKSDYGGVRRGRGRPLEAVLVTSAELAGVPVLQRPPSWLRVTIVGPYSPEGARVQRLREAVLQWRAQPVSRRLHHLLFLLSTRIHRAAWHPQRVYDQLQSADVGIIPVDAIAAREHELVPAWRVKSENRLTLKMSVGLPVVASPVPSYEPVIEQGGNGFIAHDRQQWLTYLDSLRDPQRRLSVGRSARQAVLKRYSKEEQARLLVAVLRGLIPPAK